MSNDRIRRQYRFTNTPEHLILDPRVSDRAFRLWCRLDRFAGENESAYPTRETLSIELDTSPASVDRATRELVESGWLKKERRAAGDSNLYTLMVAPPKETERLIKAAREERKKASEPRREKEREKRRAKEQRQREQQKQGRNVNPSTNAANAEVAGAPLVTGDERSDSTPLVMGDERGVVTSDETPLVTGDGEKEAPTKGSISEGDSASSLRSETGAAGTDDGALFDAGADAKQDDKSDLTDQERETGRDADGKPLKGKKLTALAQEVAVCWWEWIDTAGHEKPAQSFIACRGIIRAALANGLAVKEVKKGLARITVEGRAVTGASLQIAMNAQPGNDRGMRRGYDDVKTWGKPEDEQAAAPMTDAEIASVFGTLDESESPAQTRVAG